MANCIRCGRKTPLLSFGKSRKLCQWCRQYEAEQGGEPAVWQPVMPKPWARRRGSTEPIVTYAIFGICAAVFIAMSLAGGSLGGDTSSADLVHWGANFGPYVIAGQWWRLVTSMFVHIGILHIGFNMWCLWDLGALAEPLYGRATFASIYLLTGITGSLASIAWHPMTVSAGASGAIFGICGALIAAFKLGEFSVPREQINAVLRSVVIFAAFNLIYGAVAAQTDNAAHIGGLVSGLVLGALIAKFAPTTDTPLRRLAVVTILAAVVFGSGYWLWQSRSYMTHAQNAEQLLREKGKENEAIAELNKALHSKPDFPAARFLLANAYISTGQLPQAETQLNYLLAKNPNDMLVRFKLGLLYLNMNKPSKAEEQFTRMLAQIPNSAEAHLGMGLAVGAQGDNVRAVREFETAASLAPDLGGVYYNLGAAYARLGKMDEAISAFEKSLKNDGDDYQTEMALASAYRAKGMQREADAAVAKADDLKNRAAQNQQNAQ